MFSKLLVVWTFTAGGAGVCGAADIESPAVTSVSTAVHRLFDAAWREPPEGIDATFYREFELKKLSAQDARKQFEATFDALDGPEAERTAEREEEIQLNVQLRLKEQEVPRRLVQRIRSDGERWRLDQTVLPPEKDLEPDTRLSETYATLGVRATSDGYRAFRYVGATRSALVLPDHTAYAGSPARDWLTVPYMWIIRLTFGRLDSDNRLVRDEGKRDECIAQGGLTARGTTIRVSPEASKGPAGATLDRVEIFGEGGGRIVSMICDRHDYTRVYRFEVYGPNGNLAVFREVDDYDAEGNPLGLRMETYDENGSIVDGTSVRFLRVDTAPEFPDEVFDFRPPAGYAVIDMRQSPGQVITDGQPDAPEGGEKVSQILALGAVAPIVRERKSWEVRIELPASRPASQPTGSSSIEP